VHCWSAELFTRIATSLNPDAKALNIAIAGYLDALVGHIHGQYRDAQTALEASCKAVTPSEKSQPLVRSIKEWQKWIDTRETEITALARNDDDAHLLLQKLRRSGFQRPTGKIVEQCFTGWSIALPADVIEEIERRNPAIHRYVMLDEATDDLRSAGRRINMIQMMLSAVVAKLTGYDGPLVGWAEDGLGNLLVPDFWTTRTNDHVGDSTKRYACRR
jgi:hypothetical protein